MNKKRLLADLDVLILDFQATGANPENSFLTEAGWLSSRASLPWDSVEPAVVSFLCRLPDGVEIPRRVSRLTGLETQDLNAGLPAEEIWEKLISTASKIAGRNKNKLCPTIIHFSRYEAAYLSHLHRQFTPQMPFPFDIVCTHQVSVRLLPGLPRKSLRAMAGYFGYSVPELRRSAHHIAATAFIWRRLVGLLEDKGIGSLEVLKEWLKNTSPKSPVGSRVYLLEAAQRLNLPKKPGIYRMSRSNGDLLYIGKATSLKHRVNSYFRVKTRRNPHANHIMEMLTQVAHLEVVVTGSALEAALLEADEIKKHSPPYNIVLRQRERDIAFFSRDLCEFTRDADESHPVGPLPLGKSIPSLAAFAALLKGKLADLGDKGICSWYRNFHFYKSSPPQAFICPKDATPSPHTPITPSPQSNCERSELCSLVLGIPWEYAPGNDCFWEGVDIFRQRYSEVLKKYQGKDLIKGLLRLGKQLHLKRLEELAAATALKSEEEKNANPGESEEFFPDSTGNSDKTDGFDGIDSRNSTGSTADPGKAGDTAEPAWTPDRVAEVLEGIVCHGAHLIRRARWFCLLSESALAWNSGKTAGGNRRLLVLEGGMVTRQENFNTGVPPFPPGGWKTMAARQKGFDLMAYDRLRILTTELRRLASEEDRQVQLRLSPQVVLKRQQLLNLLKLI